MKTTSLFCFRAVCSFVLLTLVGGCDTKHRGRPDASASPVTDEEADTEEPSATEDDGNEPPTQTAIVDASVDARAEQLVGEDASARDTSADTCVFPRSGARCDECSPGYFVRSGGCVPDCGPCGDHASCDRSLASPACACVAGYRDADPGTALVCGPIRSTPGLIDEKLGDPSAWTTTAARFDANFFGMGDGLVQFERFGSCGISAIGQTFDMPLAEDSEPLVFEVEYFGVNSPDRGCNAEAALVVGGVPQALPMPSQNGTARVCLGARAYGPGVKLELRAQNESGCPEEVRCEPRAFGGIAIKPAAAGECADVGVGNADFVTRGTQGWTLDEGTRASVDGAGRLVLEALQGCQETIASNSVSIPPLQALPHPALRFDARLALGPRSALLTEEFHPYVEVALDSLFTTLQRVPLTADVARGVTVCLPSYASGTARALYLSGARPGYTCYPEDGTSYYSLSISNLAVVSDPDCATATPELDFESVPSDKAPWQLTSSEPNGARILDAPAQAHTGSRVIALRALTGCDRNAVQTHAVVPRAQGGRGPMLRFYHRRDGEADTFAFDAGRLGDFFESSAQWQVRETCIPAAFAGQLTAFEWHMGPLSNCSTTLPTLWIDDVELLLSERCH